MKLTFLEGILYLGTFLTIIRPILGQWEYEPEVLEEDETLHENKLDIDAFDLLYPPKDPIDNITDLTQERWEELLKKAQEEYEKRMAGIKTARVAPFCVNGILPYTTDTEDPDLINFKRYGIFDFPYTDAKVPMANEHGKSPHDEGVVKRIEFYNILSPDGPSETNVNGNGIGRLNQWVHIVVTMKDPVEALFIQAISGPLGLPFGEFRVDFDCKIDGVATRCSPFEKGDDTAKNVGMVIPCKYTPRASIRHPTIYAYGGNPHVHWPAQTKFHLHFNWEDVKCGEAPRMQFLYGYHHLESKVVAIRHLKVEHSEDIFVTRTYEHKLESGDGIPYPYYLEWADQMTCTPQNENEYFVANGSKSELSIVYDPNYDECIQKGPKNATVLQDGTKLSQTCPPGPFRCRYQGLVVPGKDETNVFKDPEKTKIEEVVQIREQLIEISSGDCQVKHCVHPNQTIPVLDREEPGTYKDVVTKFLQKGIHNERKSRVIHGGTMIFAWFVVAFGGMIMGRFYKETDGLSANAENGCLGIGCWLWGHIILSFLAMAGLWVGLFEIYNINKDPAFNCERYKNVSVYPDKNDQLISFCKSKKDAARVHRVIGYFSMLFFHICFVTGWARPLKTMVRKILVWTHMATGYLGKLSAVLCVVVLIRSPAVCTDIVLQVFGLELVSLLIFIALTAIQCIEDRRMGVKRKHFPVVEALEIRVGGLSMSTIKRILHPITWALTLLLFAGIVYNYVLVLTKPTLDPNDKIFVFIKSVLNNDQGQICKAPSEKYEFRVLKCLSPDAKNMFKCPKADNTLQDDN